MAKAAFISNWTFLWALPASCLQIELFQIVGAFIGSVAVLSSSGHGRMSMPLSSSPSHAPLVLISGTLN
jgi:hypothetical protein